VQENTRTQRRADRIGCCPRIERPCGPQTFDGRLAPRGVFQIGGQRLAGLNAVLGIGPERGLDRNAGKHSEIIEQRQGLVRRPVVRGIESRQDRLDLFRIRCAEGVVSVVPDELLHLRPKPSDESAGNLPVGAGRSLPEFEKFLHVFVFRRRRSGSVPLLGLFGSRFCRNSCPPRRSGRMRPEVLSEAPERRYP
jgi:hypothetical protein